MGFYRKIAIVLLLIAFRGYAQDVIYKQDGTSVKAKVVEIGTAEIKYKRFDNLDGPNYAIDRKDVILIVYANGLHELITPRVSADVGIKKEDAPKVRYSNAESRNGLSFDLLDIFISNIGITYERYSESGKFGLRIPISYSLRTGSLSNYSGALVGANKRYSVSACLNYYPFGQIKHTYFAGLNMSYGEYDYYYYSFVSYYNVGYKRSSSLISGHLMNGYQLRITPHFNMQFILGLGLARNSELNSTNNVNSSLTCVFNMGYRF